MKKNDAFFSPVCCLCLPEGFIGFTLLDVMFPSNCRGSERDARTSASSHLALIPRSLSGIDDVPSVRGLTSIWVSNGERWLVKDSQLWGQGSDAGL